MLLKIMQAQQLPPQLTDINSLDGWGTTRLALESVGYKAYPYRIDRFCFSALNACDTVSARLGEKSFRQQGDGIQINVKLTDNIAFKVPRQRSLQDHCVNF